MDDSLVPGTDPIVHRTLGDGSGQDYFFYRPASGAVAGPLFVAIHDISRNAHGLARAFAGTCARYGATLVAPQFDADRYPNYQRLGRSRNRLDSGKRADEALDAILQEVASLDGVAPERICLFGYGAGGRFAMRYAMARPDRVAAAVIVSPETYTSPSLDRRFPQGIGPSSKRMDLQFDPQKFLRVPMTLLEVVDEGDAPRRRPVQVVRTSGGTNRDKGRGWVAAMKSAADACQLESQVSYREIEGPFESFEAFVERGSLPERVFEALPGSLSGLPVVYTQSGLPDHIRDRGGSLGLRDVTDVEFEAPAARSAGLPPAAARGLLALLLLAFLVPLGLWIHYRSTNVVSRDAVVRSHIADIGAPVDGVVKSVDVDAGDHVRAGQIVARLEDSNFAAQAAQARSRLERANRKLEVERLAIDNERERLASSFRGVSAGFSAARAGVRVAESRAEEAQRQVELQKSLVSQGLVPAERARTAETQLRTALALAAESRAEASAAGAGQDLARVASNGLSVREKQVSVLESEIAALRADLAAAESKLDGTIIRAPDDGAVVRRIVQPGGSTTVGQPIISLWVGEQIWVEAWVDEDDLADIGVGSPAVVSFKSHPDREFAGVVESLGVSTDFELPDSVVPQPRSERMRSTPLISVRIRLDDPADDLFPGLSAVVGIRKKAE